MRTTGKFGVVQGREATVAIGGLCPFCSDGLRFEIRGASWVATQQGRPHLCEGLAAAFAASRATTQPPRDHHASPVTREQQARPTPLDAVAHARKSGSSWNGRRLPIPRDESARTRVRRPVQLELQAVD
ncbi:hypothetical protein [Paraburkholderia jirisanensis]